MQLRSEHYWVWLYVGVPGNGSDKLVYSGLPNLPYSKKVGSPAVALLISRVEGPCREIYGF